MQEALKWGWGRGVKVRSERSKEAKDISHEGAAEATVCLDWAFSGGMVLAGFKPGTWL